MRTFIAIDIFHNSKIVQLQNKIHEQNGLENYYIKPTKKDNLHITLEFLGEKSVTELQEIIFNLKNFSFSPFDIVFDRIGYFPNTYSPKIIWLGVDNQSTKRLYDVHQKILNLMQNIKKKSIESERNLKNKNNDKNKNNTKSDTRFFPHLTIFRIKPGYIINKSFSPVDDMYIHKEEIKKISIKQSILKPDGPHYSDLLVINAAVK